MKRVILYLGNIVVVESGEFSAWPKTTAKSAVNGQVIYGGAATHRTHAILSFPKNSTLQTLQYVTGVLLIYCLARQRILMMDNPFSRS